MNHAWKLALGAAPLLLAAACSHDTAKTDTSQFTTMVPEVRPAPDEKITRFADANNDGKVTREEAKADPNLVREFDHFDLDKNGILDRGEFARLEAEAREERAGNASTLDLPEQHEFRGHPLQPNGSRETLNRTGERGP